MRYNVGSTGKAAIELIVITSQCVAPESGYKVHFYVKIIGCGDMNLSLRPPAAIRADFGKTLTTKAKLLIEICINLY